MTAELADTEVAMNPYPDGTLPLTVTDPRRSDLEPLVAGVDLVCYFATHADRHREDLRAGCLHVIRPGRWYVRHVLHGVNASIDERPYNYCAACAIRECAAWGVVEVATL